MRKFMKAKTHESSEMFARALEMLNRNNVADAIKSLEAALQILPDNAEYLSHYGLCVALERDNFKAGRRLCERAIRMEPREIVHQVNLGRVYRLQGDRKAAHEAFIGAWQLNTSHPAPATQLLRMGVRRPPMLPFLDRSHWLNVRLGRLRVGLHRASRSIG